MRPHSTVVSCLVATAFLLSGLGADGATSTSFSPTSVVMAQGASTTITIGTVGLSAGPDPAPAAFAAYYQIVLPAGYTVSNVACVGLFAGATPSPDPIAGGAVSCEFPWIGVTASSGDVMTFTLTRGAGAPTGVVSMDDMQGSFYALTNEDLEPVGTTNTVTILDPEPDLAITKSHSGTFTQGQPGSYTITVENVGTGPTTGTVTVTDTLPSGLTATAFSGTGWTCTLAPLSCSRADVLAPAASYPPITLAVNVSPTAPASLTNTATVATPGDPNPANDTATDVTTIAQLPDLAITKSHSGTFTQGQPGSYTITVGNVGTGPTTGTVTVTDTLPSGLTATAFSGTGWTCTLAPLSCSRADALAPAASYPPLTLAVNVSPTAPASLTNTATVATPGDPNPANDTATDVTAIAQLPDLAITKSHSGTFTQGQPGSYTMTVGNVGPGPTTGTVTVTDTLPSGLTATAFSGTGWTCTLAPLSCSRADVLAPAASYPPLTLAVNVSPTAPASLTNTATVATPGDPNPANDTATDVTTIAQLPDLAITKSHSGTFLQGQPGSYTLTVSNVGPGPTTGTVTVTDTLPSGLTATAFSGTGWTCTLAPLSCSRADVLAPAASYPPLTLAVNVSPTAPASLTNTATVATPGDPNPANDTATDVTTIAQLPDLAITKSHSGTFLQGQPGSYTLTVSNVGPGPTTGTVTVTDTLPSGLTATAFSGTGWTCTLAPLSCSRADALAPAASYPPLTLAVNVSPTAPASLTNTATVSTPGDPNPANDTATDVTTITALAVEIPTLDTVGLLAFGLVLAAAGAFFVRRV